MISEVMRGLVYEFGVSKQAEALDRNPQTIEKGIKAYEMLTACIAELEESDRILNILREAGVDDWEGYELIFQEEE